MATLIPVDVTEAIMGHEAYLTEVYRRYSEEELAKFYQQGERALSIFTEAEEVGKLRVEIEDKNKQLQSLVNNVVGENLELKRRISKTEEVSDSLKSENTALKEQLKRLDDKFSSLEKTVSEMRKTLD